MQEGVIQYHLDFSRQALPAGIDVSALNACRSRLFARKLIGQDDKRYAGLGYGNISQRLVPSRQSGAFIITGSQTGHLSILEKEHYALVMACDPMRNYLQAAGEIQPSSEAMTHAVIYQILPEVQAVIHVHWPDLWQNAENSGLLTTAPDIPYGTPHMAEAVQGCLLRAGLYAGALAMLGHEDGLLFWGRSLAEAEARLKQYYKD